MDGLMSAGQAGDSWFVSDVGLGLRLSLQAADLRDAVLTGQNPCRNTSIGRLSGLTLRVADPGKPVPIAPNSRKHPSMDVECTPALSCSFVGQSGRQLSGLSSGTHGAMSMDVDGRVFRLLRSLLLSDVPVLLDPATRMTLQVTDPGDPAPTYPNPSQKPVH